MNTCTLYKNTDEAFQNGKHTKIKKELNYKVYANMLTQYMLVIF